LLLLEKLAAIPVFKAFQNCKDAPFPACIDLLNLGVLSGAELGVFRNSPDAQHIDADALKPIFYACGYALKFDI
jgi:hypothetical protein